jgi:hypothetical protein
VRYSRYRAIEQAIAAGDSSGIKQRWLYGRRLLCTDEMCTPDGNLRDGKREWLIDRAKRNGQKLSATEISYRLKAAKTYPSEACIVQILEQYENWWALIRAKFPQVTAPEGSIPFNPLETDELLRQSDRRGQRIMQHAGGQEGFDFGPDFKPDDPLADIGEWLDEQDEINARFTAKASERRSYYGDLCEAVAWDLSKTWGEAQRALDLLNGEGDDGDGS